MNRAFEVTKVVSCLLLFFFLVACFERGKKEKHDKEARSGTTSEKLTSIAQGMEIRTREPRWTNDSNATIMARLATEPSHLNPMLAGDYVAVQIALGDIYETLLRAAKPGGQETAHLAESFVVSEQGKRWRFTLRAGVRFHDGSLLQISDVLFSFTLAAKISGPLMTGLDDLLSMKVISNSTIEFRFEKSRLNRSSFFAAVPIVSRRTFEKVSLEGLAQSKCSREPNGSGPFRLRTWRNQEIVLERFSAYWGTRSKVQRIVYKVVPDRTRTVAMLRAGTLDVAMRFPTKEALDVVKELSHFTAVRERLPAYTAAVFNTASPKLGLEKRRALRNFFDRETLSRELYSGYGQSSLGPFPNDSGRSLSVSEVSKLRPLTNKVGLAAAFSKTSPPLTILVPRGSRTMERLADIWKSELRSVVSMEIDRVPFSELLDRVRAGNYEVCLLSFTTSESVDLFSLFHSSLVGQSNLSRIQDPKLDNLLEKMRETMDVQTLKRLSQDLHRQLLFLAPTIFLSQDIRLGIVRTDVAGIGESSHLSGARSWRRKL